MNYKIGDKSFAVNPGGSIPTITFKANLSSTHYHVQVQTSVGWQMVVDETGLGKSVPMKGGPIASAADFPGKKFFWDITLISQDEATTVDAKLQLSIDQDGKNLLTVNDQHSITGQETYYEYLYAH